MKKNRLRPPAPSIESKADAAFDWVSSTGLGPEIAREIRSTVRRRRRRRAALGAVAVLLAVGWGSWLRWARPASPAPESAPAAGATWAMSAPEQRRLPDGSVVELRAGAEVDFAFSPKTRRVELVRGEALFRVVKDARRPFIVSARGVDVRAVGTAFAVGESARDIEVLVTEGVVAVGRSAGLPDEADPESPAVSDPVRVAAGERALAPPGDGPVTVAPISSAEMAQRLAWRVPRFEFSGTPLSEVLVLFRRHGNGVLRLGDATCADMRVSGVVRADNREALLQLLAIDYGISAEDRGGDTVLVRAR